MLKVIGVVVFGLTTLTMLAPARAEAPKELPKAQMTDAKLLKEMLVIAAEQLKPDQVLTGVIVDKDWNVEQNERGIVERRTINGAFAIKQPAGKCRVFSVLFEQKAAGAKKFNATQFAGIGVSSEIDCAKAK